MHACSEKDLAYAMNLLSSELARRKSAYNKKYYAEYQKVQKEKRRKDGKWLSKEKIFVEHIEKHLKEMSIKGKVECKICGKDIDKICEELRKE